MKPIYFKRQRLLIIFVLALVVSVTLGTILPAPTQVPLSTSTTPRQELVEKIKDYAERHVNSDTPMKTEVVIELYRQNPVGLSEPEIAEIYETEYERLDRDKKDQPKNPLGQLPQGISGWIAASILFILLVFRDLLRDWLKNTTKRISDWLYQKFAGTSLFRSIALKKYRQALIDKYQKLNIPFRPNRPLEMGKVYVPLKVAGTSDRSLIEAENAVQQYHRLMVKGAPGSGKSMLLKYLALSYSEGRLNLSDRPVPILLELNRLNDADLTVEKLEQQLVEACDRNDFPKAKRFVSQSLKDGHLLLLLDGLDEVSSSVRSDAIRCLKDLLDKYENCRAIITCRTAVYNNEFVNVTEQTLEIAEFSDQQIRRFLRAWKSQMPRDKSVDQLITTLRDRPKIMTLARNPLLLTIIAYLYTDKPFVLPHSRAKFYTKATNVLLELRDQERNIPNQYSDVSKRRVLQYLALYAQDSANRQQQDRRSLPYEVVLEQVKQVLPSLNLELKEANSIVDEIVNRSGLLLPIDGGQRYQFAHLTLQEYFVASALSDRQDELILRWENAPSDWREIVKLWCGLANNSTALIERVYRSDRLTGFECLADAQEVEPEVAQPIIDHFKTKLGQEEDEGVISAFGSVAADLRPRGKELFEFLAERLANRESLASREVAAKALSMTNLPQATERLAQFYKDDEVTIREALVRMGNLAVPQLKLLAEQGKSAALEDLKFIATPEAAIALVPFLWDSHLADLTAWHLGYLLQLPEIEEALRGENALITPEQQKAPYLDWVWHPFDPSQSLNVSIIAGRIAHLLVNQLKPNVDVEFFVQPHIDPRLMIPICAIAGFEGVKLPKKISSDAIALLEQSEFTKDIQRQMSKEVEKILTRTHGDTDRRWSHFLLNLPRPLQLDLLRRLIESPSRLSIRDWRNLYENVNYQFFKSRHYWGIWSVAVLLSMGAILQIIIFMAKNINNSASVTLMIVTFPIILTFLMILWKEVRSTEDSLNSPLLISLGFFGVWTFTKESARFWQKALVWEGITVLYDNLTGAFARIFAGAGIVAGFVAFFFFAEAFPGAVAGIVAGIVAGAFAGVFAGAGAGAFDGAFAVAGAFPGAFPGAFAGAGAGAFPGAFDGDVAEAGAIAGIVAGAVAGAFGYGLGIWYKGTKERLGSIRWLSILAFPWFCWFPLVLGFVSLALLNTLSIGLPFTLLFWLIVLGLCAFCWIRGQILEAKARNPLRGILD